VTSTITELNHRPRRVWGIATTTHAHSCTLCEATCGIAVTVDGRRVVEVRGDPDDPASRGYLCPKAVALADLQHDPDRLRTPLIRDGRDSPGGNGGHGGNGGDGGWRAAGWDEALDLVARRLAQVRRRHGRDAVGVYQGNPTAHNLGLITYGQLLLRNLGTRNAFSATSIDHLPHLFAALLMFGHQLLIPVPDVDRCDLFVCLGGNPAVSNGSIMTAPNIRGRLRAILARGGRVVVIDPRRTETADLAGEHLFIRPGTDAALLLSIVHVLFDENLVRPGRLAPFLTGVAEVRAAAADFPPEATEPLTGVPAGEVRALARALASTPRAVVYGRVGLCTQEFGGLAAWLVPVVNALTGHLDTPGGAMFSTPAFDPVALASRTGHGGAVGRWHSRVGGLPEFGGELPVAALAAEIRTPGPRQIRALITSAGNPVLSTPNGARLEEALAGLDFMVAIDPYLNETTRFAHVILPPTGPLERAHYELPLALFAVRNTAKYSPAVLPREPDQRHDWEICLELARRLLGPRPLRPLARPGWALLRRLGPELPLALGLLAGPYGLRRLLRPSKYHHCPEDGPLTTATPLPGKRASKYHHHDVDGPLTTAAARAWGGGVLTLGRLRRRPHGVDLGPLRPRLPGRLRTRDRMVHLAPREYLDDLPRLRRRLDTPVPRDGLVLIGRRHLRSSNTWLHNSRRLVKGRPRCTLLMHPSDAAARGLADGATARLSSRVGAIEVPVELTDAVMPGVVSLPHGWGHGRAGTRLSVASAHPGVSVNDVTDERFVDPLTGNAAVSGVPVEVTAVATAPTTNRRYPPGALLP
jgi:anaerobic selenocysteine-containing dehydrogenase